MMAARAFAAKRCGVVAARSHLVSFCCSNCGQHDHRGGFETIVTFLLALTLTRPSRPPR